MSGPPSGGIGAMGPQHDEQPRQGAPAPAGEPAPTTDAPAQPEAGTGLERPEAIRAAEEVASQGGRPLTLAAEDAGEPAPVAGDTYVPNDAAPSGGASDVDDGGAQPPVDDAPT